MKHVKRKFSSKLSHHITLKTTRSFFITREQRRIVDDVLVIYAKRFGIKLYHRAIQVNHIHLVVLAKSSTDLSNFLRCVAGVIAQRVTRSFRGAKKSFVFWLGRPWSRLVSWGRDFHGVVNYVALNYLESIRAITIRKSNEKGAMVIRKFRHLIDEAVKDKLTKPRVSY